MKALKKERAAIRNVLKVTNNDKFKGTLQARLVMVKLEISLKIKNNPKLKEKVWKR